MRYKAGFVTGAAVGYVLGARAGRRRYEQIVTAARTVRGHPAVDQLVGQATALVDVIRVGIAKGLGAGARSLRDLTEEGRSA